jgi:DinB superfamily
MNTQPEPKLAPPGAGLPKPELLIARLMFAWQRRTGTRELFNAKFQRERETVQTLYKSCDEETGATRVLIQRVPGLEDSSRYWSVWMTLEHLRIMHQGLARTIQSLARGVVPQGKASTANVKPAINITSAVVKEFEQSSDELTATVEKVPNLNTQARFEHPWFGPLNAAGWHAMASTHLSIHREQIARILRK